MDSQLEGGEEENRGIGREREKTKEKRSREREKEIREWRDKSFLSPSITIWNESQSFIEPVFDDSVSSYSYSTSLFILSLPPSLSLFVSCVTSHTFLILDSQREEESPLQLLSWVMNGDSLFPFDFPDFALSFPFILVLHVSLSSFLSSTPS